MSLINTFAFETVVNQNLMKMNRGGLERIDDGPVKLQDVDCKIEWDEWSEMSECLEKGFRFMRRRGIVLQRPMGRGRICPTSPYQNTDSAIAAVSNKEVDRAKYYFYEGDAVYEYAFYACEVDTTPPESEETEEADDVIEQGEQDGEADDTAEGEEEEEEVNTTTTTTTVSTSGQVEPSCPANSTYDEDEKMCRCDLGYSLDESTGQCNRNTLGFILDAKWWILSAVGAGGAYLYHRSR